MLSQSDEYLTDLEVAQRDVQEAARRIAEDRHYLASLSVTTNAMSEIAIRVPAPYGDTGPTNINPGPSMTFYPFTRLPMELQRQIIHTGSPANRVVKVLSDDYDVTVTDPATNKTTTEKILRAKAAHISISPLSGVSVNIQRMLRDDRYITGFRLCYFRLYFNFENDTLFFKNAAAFNSLIGPLGDYERRDEMKEEKLVEAFNKNGPQNVVLAGPVKLYEDLYSVIKKLAWVDTLIMEEPARSFNTPRSESAAKEKAIVDAIENSWRDVRPGSEVLPIIRFLPRQNINLITSNST